MLETEMHYLWFKYKNFYPHSLRSKPSTYANYLISYHYYRLTLAYFYYPQKSINFAATS